MGFERFEGTGSRTSTEPLVSLRKSGGIGINKAAMSEWFTDTEAVVLHYDEDNNLLGLEPADPDDEHSYTLSMSEGGGSVTPSAFLRTFGLVPDHTTRYPAEWDDDEEFVVADLDEMVNRYGSPENNES